MNVNYWNHVFITFLTISSLDHFVNAGYYSWANTSNTNDPIADIKANTTDTDLFYIFTGDTQYWWECDDTNLNCQAALKPCTDMYSKIDPTCQHISGNYTNWAQFTSISRLAQQIAAFHPGKVEGLVINGDLTAFGHGSEELYYFRKMWRKNSTVDPSSYNKVSPELDQSFVDNIKEIYLGLGNHDYANNVDQCFGNNCAISMIDYMLKSYPATVSAVDMSDKASIMNPYHGFTFPATEQHGSMAYSWKSCNVNQTCYLFLQLHNYPTYTTYISTYNKVYTITDSLTFVKTQLAANPNTGVVLNFHDYDTMINNMNDSPFTTALTGAFRIYAIFIAHIHDSVGLQRYLCINNRTVPIIYSGSVPANNYILAKFPTNNLRILKNPPTFYAVNVRDTDGNSVVTKLDNIQYTTC